MAKQMSYETPDGTVHASSYWKLSQVNLYLGTIKTGQLVFEGFKDAAARLAGKVAIAAKVYNLSDTDIVTYFSGVVAGNDQLLVKAYLLAMERLDTNGVSFFAGASDV